MKLPRCRWIRVAMLEICLFPLLATGPCLSIAEESAITGFFNVFNAALVEQARDALGLPPVTSGT